MHANVCNILMASPTFRRYSTMPDWVDLNKLDRGGNIFLRYLAASTAALFFLSLVGGFSAPLITKVLSCTG